LQLLKSRTRTTGSFCRHSQTTDATKPHTDKIVVVTIIRSEPMVALPSVEHQLQSAQAHAYQSSFPRNQSVIPGRAACRVH
jgi:hypothetical protein